MPNILPLDMHAADPQTAQTLNAVKAKIGMIPNLFATFAHAPAALNAYLQFSEILNTGRLNARQREIIALAVSQTNSCQYCLSAHTLLGKGAGLSDDEVREARNGAGGSAVDNAIAVFARKVALARGHLVAGDLDEVRKTGVDDGMIIEIISHVALTVLTNYTNNVAGTVVDFPVVNVTL